MRRHSQSAVMGTVEWFQHGDPKDCHLSCGLVHVVDRTSPEGVVGPDALRTG